MPELKQYRITADSASSLVAGIEAGVARGALLPGQRLPSVRRLAVDVGLSPATVAAGLAELRRRGVVVSEPRRGTRIGDGPPVPLPAARMPVPQGARDLSLGNPDPALLPDLGPALARVRRPARLYGESPELPELLAAAREGLAADGVPAEHLCVVSGALDGIERVLSAWLRPGDRVAVESPGYAALFDLLRAQGLGLEPVAIDRRGMLPGALAAVLQRGAVAAVLTPRGQNPTGAAHDARRVGELAAVLAEHPRALLIEDDHLGPVAGAPLHTLAGGRLRWAGVRSVAKAFGPDLRLAVMAGDEATIARVRGRQMCGPGWVSHILQGIVAELWGEPATRRLVARAAGVYAERRRALIEELHARGVTAEGDSGLNVWIEVGEEASAAAALAQRGWVVAPGARYRIAAGPPAIRVTTATLEPRDAARLAGEIALALAPAQAIRSG